MKSAREHWFHISRAALALANTLGVYALLVPALFIGGLLLRTDAAAIVPLLPILLVAIALGIGFRFEHVFKATILAVHRTLSPRRAGALKPLLYTGCFTATIFTVFGLAGGKIWELIGTLVVLAINIAIGALILWVVGGTWYSPRVRPSDNPAHLEDFLHDLTEACKDFFAPEAKYTYKQDVEANGKIRVESYVNEDERYAATREAITTLEEIAPAEYRITFRNATGKADDKFISFFEGVASQLGVYSFNLRDDNPTKGIISITVLDAEPDNELTQPHGMLLWK